MVPLAVVTEKIENLHEGLDLERGWLIHKTWGTVFLWWAAMWLPLGLAFCGSTSIDKPVLAGFCKGLYIVLIGLFWYGVWSQMYGTRLQIEEN